MERNRPPANLLREKCVIIVAPIYLVIVEVPGNSIETHHAELAVCRRARRQKNEIGKVAPVQRQILNCSLADYGADRRLRGIHQRRVRGHDDFRIRASQGQLRPQAYRRSDGHNDAVELRDFETGFLDAHLIRSRTKVRKKKMTAGIAGLCRG